MFFLLLQNIRPIFPKLLRQADLYIYIYFSAEFQSRCARTAMGAKIDVILKTEQETCQPAMCLNSMEFACVVVVLICFLVGGGERHN